jgi:prophage antirepressor-like protein
MENENTVQQFLNDNFGEVRAIKINNVVWFCANDCLKILEYSENGWSTKIGRLNKNGVTKCKVIDSMKREQLTNFINEPNLYKLIFGSKMDKAEEFQDWICEIVIPSIRKDGGYIDKEEKVTTGEMSEDELIYKAMQMMDKKIHRLEEEKEKLQNENAEMKPIVSLVDKFVNTNNCYDIGTYAKILESKELGRTRLFAWLKDKKILMSNNVPYQVYTKYFKVIPVVNQRTGRTDYKTLLKPVGITYIYNKLLKDGKVIEKPLEKVIEDLAPAM